MIAFTVIVFAVLLIAMIVSIVRDMRRNKM